MPNKGLFIALFYACFFAACGTGSSDPGTRSSKTDAAELDAVEPNAANPGAAELDPLGSNEVEPARNTFVLKNLDPILVERAALGTTPCCGYTPAKIRDQSWGICLRATADFPHPPDKPSLEAGTDGPDSPIASAQIYLQKTDGSQQDVSAHFSAWEHCSALAHYQGLQSSNYTSLIPVEDSVGVYQFYIDTEGGLFYDPLTRATAPKGSLEELLFRSIHPDFSHYANSFNQDQIGVRQLGVEVVFWADQEMEKIVERGDLLAWEIEFENGSRLREEIALF